MRLLVCQVLVNLHSFVQFNRMIDTTEGELIVDDTNVSELKGKSLRRFRRKIGMIFQSFNLVSRSTVIRNVLTSNVPDMPWYKVLLGIYSKEQKNSRIGSFG